MFKLGNACHVWRLWHHLARKPHRGFWQFPNVLQNGGRVKYFLKNTPTRGTENISTRTAIPLGLPSILCTDQPQWTSLTLRSVWMVPWGCAIDWIVMSPPPKKIHILKFNPQCDSIWKWGLWKMIRSWEWNPYEWDEGFYKTQNSLIPFHHVRILQ